MNAKRLRQIVTGIVISVGVGIAHAGPASAGGTVLPNGIDKFAFEAATFDLATDADMKDDKLSAEVEVEVVILPLRANWASSSRV